jgi:hypothetical protein
LGHKKMEDTILRTDYYDRRPFRHSALEQACEMMMRPDLDARAIEHWRAKAAALLVIDKITLAERRWKKERLASSMVFKVYDPTIIEAAMRRRRKARALRRQALRLLAR